MEAAKKNLFLVARPLRPLAPPPQLEPLHILQCQPLILAHYES